MAYTVTISNTAPMCRQGAAGFLNVHGAEIKHH